MEIPPLDQRGPNAGKTRKLVLDVAMKCKQLPKGPKPVYPMGPNDYVVVQSVDYNQVYFVTEEQYRKWSKKTRSMVPTSLNYLKKAPCVGALLIVNSRQPSRCYRVRVLRVFRQYARVYLIDIGETRTMKWADLSPMPAAWKRIPNTLLKIHVINDWLGPTTMEWLKTYAGGVRFWNLSVAPAITLSEIVKRVFED
uniref:Tudor domain-containing protein n=1 Tax=Anopheles atroparvus TaxID=41427 RepID=A0A182IJX5_ANOAO